MISLVHVRIWVGLAFLFSQHCFGHDVGKRSSASIAPNGVRFAEFDADGHVREAHPNHKATVMRAEMSSPSDTAAPGPTTPHSNHQGDRHGAPAVELTEVHVVAKGGPQWMKKRTPGNIAGDTKAPHDKHPIPAWAQIIISSTLMLLIVTAWWMVMRMRNNPVPRGDSERLAAVLQDALGKVRSLEEQLETRQEVDAMFDDSDDEGAPLDEATAADRQARELRNEAARNTRAIHEAAAKTAEQSQKLIAGAEHVQKAFTEALDKSRDTVEDFARTETSDLYSEINKAVAEPTANFPKYEPPSWMTDEGTVRLPPLMQLISGVFASSQIRAMRYYNSGGITLDLILIGLSVAVFALNWTKSCHDPALWVWHIGLLSLTVADLVIRTIIVAKATKSITFLAQGRALLEKEDAKHTGGGMLEVFANFQRKSSRFFDAFFKYSNLVESWPYYLSHVMNLLSLIWGAAGMTISIHNIIVDTLDCSASLALLYMHTYSFLFVMLLTWKILGVLYWALDMISGSSLARSAIVRTAREWDDDTMKGMPVVMSLAQSFVLKDSSEFFSMKTRKVLQEIQELEEAAREMEEKLRLRKFAREQLQERSQHADTEQAFMERSQRRIASTLDEFKPIVGLIASNATTTPGPNPMGAGSSSLPPPRHSSAASSFQEPDKDGVVESF